MTDSVKHLPRLQKTIPACPEIHKFSPVIISKHKKWNWPRFQSDKFHNKSTCSVQYLWQGNSGLDPHSGAQWLTTFNGDFLVQGHIYSRISMKIQSVFSGDTSQTVEKCPRNVEVFIKNSWIWNGWLHHFFLVHSYIYWKIFRKTGSVVFYAKLLTDRQTDIPGMT